MTTENTELEDEIEIEFTPEYPNEDTIVLEFIPDTSEGEV